MQKYTEKIVLDFSFYMRYQMDLIYYLVVCAVLFPLFAL